MNTRHLWAPGAVVSLLLAAAGAATAAPEAPTNPYACDDPAEISICLSIPFPKENVSQLINYALNKYVYPQIPGLVALAEWAVATTLLLANDAYESLGTQCPGPGGVQAMVANCQAYLDPVLADASRTINDLADDVMELVGIIVNLILSAPGLVPWAVNLASEVAGIVTGIANAYAGVVMAYAGEVQAYGGQAAGAAGAYADEVGDYALEHIYGDCGPFSPCPAPAPTLTAPPLP